MKKAALFLSWLFAVCGIVAAQVDLTNFIQTGRATREMTGGGLRAAHPSLPIGSMPTIRNVATGVEATVTVTGRIPKSAERIIDVSVAAAGAIGLAPGGYVVVLFPANAGSAAPQSPNLYANSGGVNVVIRNSAPQIPGASITVSNHVRIPERRVSPPPAQRVAVIPGELERVGIREEIEHLGIRGVLVHEVDNGVMLLPENIHFQSGTAAMLPGGSEEIGKVAAILGLFPERNLLVAGHANLGSMTAEQRMQLTVDRAGVVADYLIGLNIPANRITVRGYGAERMIAYHAGESAWRNRRVEITILDN